MASLLKCDALPRPFPPILRKDSVDKLPRTNFTNTCKLAEN